MAGYPPGMAKKTSKAKAPRRRGGRTPGVWTLLAQGELKTFRKDAKLSRSSLAGLLGVSSTSVQNWETGRSVPLTRYQEQIVALMKGGVPQDARRGRVRSSTGVIRSNSSPAKVRRTRRLATRHGRDPEGLPGDPQGRGDHAGTARGARDLAPSCTLVAALRFLVCSGARRSRAGRPDERAWPGSRPRPIDSLLPRAECARGRTRPARGSPSGMDSPRRPS